MIHDADNQLDFVYLDRDAGGDYPVAEYRYDVLDARRTLCVPLRGTSGEAGGRASRSRRIEFRNYYDGSGIHCSSTPCTVTTHYVHDNQNPPRGAVSQSKGEWGASGNVIAEYDAASTPMRQRYYVHGTSYIDERAVMRDEVPTTPKDYYYLLKDLYTVVGLANKQGHEVERYVYDAYGKATTWSTLTGDMDFNGVVDANDRSVWLGVYTSMSPPVDPCVVGSIYDVDGNGLVNFTDRSVIVGQWTSANNKNAVIPASAKGNPYYFTGRTLDVFKDAISGSPGSKPIYHYRARYYEPEHGRFPQRDPSGYVDGANLYEYVRSSPTVANDPTGRQSNGPEGPFSYGNWCGARGGGNLDAIDCVDSACCVHDECYKRKWGTQGPGAVRQTLHLVLQLPYYDSDLRACDRDLCRRLYCMGKQKGGTQDYRFAAMLFFQCYTRYIVGQSFSCDSYRAYNRTNPWTEEDCRPGRQPRPACSKCK